MADDADFSIVILVYMSNLFQLNDNRARKYYNVDHTVSAVRDDHWFRLNKDSVHEQCDGKEYIVRPAN